MPKMMDLTGQKFGRLTVTHRGPNHITPNGSKVTMWHAACSCGNSTLVASQKLRTGHTQSCGCLWREKALAAAHRASRKQMVTYGGAHNRVHRERGRAKNHPCWDCGQPAFDWSYNHEDPDEVEGIVTMRGRDFLMPYSLKPEFYVPRCRTCHSAFDRRHLNTRTPA